MVLESSGFTLKNKNTNFSIGTEVKEPEIIIPVEKVDKLGAPAPKPKLGFDKAPDFTAKLQDKSVVAGNKLRLMCSVTGLPSPKISWFKDGHQIVSGEPYLITVSLVLLLLSIILLVYCKHT